MDQVILSIETPNAPPMTYMVPSGGEISIGRDETCTVVLASPDISRRHVSVMIQSAAIVVRDSSSNGTQVMIVDGTYGYIYNTVTNVFVQITDVDFPANPVTVTFLAGRFIVNFAGSSRFYVSDNYNGLSWEPLLFANAETNPDPILAVWARLPLLRSKQPAFVPTLD